MHNEACNIKSSMLRPYNGSFIEILFKYICGVRERITKKKNIFKMDTTDIHWCQIDIKNSFIWVMLFAMLCHHIYIILYYHWPHKCIHKNIRHSFNKKKFGNSYFLWILINVYNNRFINGNWSRIFVKLLRKGTSGGIAILVILYIFLLICISK